jgi:putative transposase
LSNIVGGVDGNAGPIAVTSGTITDELINEYINEQEGEPVHEDDGRFQIDPS